MSSRPELKVDSINSLLQQSANLPQVDDEGGFIKFFKSLPAKDDETIRVFDRGDWYTAHGEYASFVARTVSLSLHALQRS